MWTVRVACLALAVASAIGSPRFLGEVRDNAADDNAKYTLPEGFLLGAGTSAYQAEGAWDADGKGVNVFDHYYHSKNYSEERTGDVAADHYHRYKEDIALAKKIGLQIFRLSISWARIFPKGTRDLGINKQGVDHYHDVIDELRKNSIEPFITIFHFDYPQLLEDKFGGWLSEKMTDAFADYADYVFEQYGSKVKYWLTINEASMYCNLNGAMGMVPPGTMTTEDKRKMCLHNLLIAHSKAHKIYHEKYKNKYNGLIGFGVGPNFSRPNSTAEEDIEASDKDNMNNGIGLSIETLVSGDYPETAKTSDRPTFTDAQKELLKNSIDFAGVNVYGGNNVSASGSSGGGGGGGGPPGPPDGGDGGGGGGGPPDGPDGGGGSGGGPPGPPGDGGGSANTESAWTLREIPKWVNKRWNIPVIFTESGLGSGTGVDDWDTRAVYCSAYLRELAAGINEDGNKVIAYTMWSFIDSFEFGTYDMGWGMVAVDYKNKTLKRTLKKSWTFFKTVAETRKVPLVKAGSEPFPAPSGAATPASVSGSLLLAPAALLVSRWLSINT
ncbi:Furostanol glycoside 26-O-beta-glucosidase [Frankliniella fusca]|uniref:Furostanol glycoside 26-O-beta-glucosidase n=1 Tax=Frankliniella fusca TaxID=407009 RepID=A0AAE1H9D3_9NEOP|nr:Furostanol glycoside 26-O-beta-glucosidase [Frankliniella fusca]